MSGLLYRKPRIHAQIAPRHTAQDALEGHNHEPETMEDDAVTFGCRRHAGEERIHLMDLFLGFEFAGDNLDESHTEENACSTRGDRTRWV